MAKKSVKLYTDNVLEEFYKAILNDTLDQLHIPHSDVFYVRSAVEGYYATKPDSEHYNKKFTLKHVEESMRAEGWTEGSYAKKEYVRDEEE